MLAKEPFHVQEIQIKLCCRRRRGHHVRAILSKLNAANRAEAVALALQHGLLKKST